MKNTWKRVLSAVLSLVMVFALVCPTVARAADEQDKGWEITWEQVDNDSVTNQLSAKTKAPAEEPSLYKDTDVVRVSIVLKDEGTVRHGFSTHNIAGNASAMSYRAGLQEKQNAMAARISDEVLGGKALDVVWNLTLAANMISANVTYGSIAAIEAIPGVEEVIIETRYEPAVASVGGDDPSMATSKEMIGSAAAWAQGYTGAGSRIAIVDTGVDDDHQSFDGGALKYALEQNAEEAGMTYEEYAASINLLTADEIASVWSQLNASKFIGIPEGVYVSEKIAYGVNYVDKDLDINHDNDEQGEHGSHVTGIATGNRFIPQDEGYAEALTAVATQGVAPDAQLLTMKVFGKGGGAYDSDYMVAIEDAIMLGCDSVNLSLGSGSAGASTNATYQAILDSFADSDTVVVMSAGNAYAWSENALIGYNYSDDPNFDTVGSPGSYTNTLAVASVDNDGSTGSYLIYNDEMVFYSETSGYNNTPIKTIAGEHDFVLIDGIGANDDSGLDQFADPEIKEILEGKIGMCFRGTSSFYMKANASIRNGAIATVICNNQAGVINMDLTGYTYSAPAVSITQADAQMIMASAEEHQTVTGIRYYTGKITVSKNIAAINNNSEFYTMSDFSSWGIPGSLEMKPEITAPGGNIYSVNGAVAGGKDYELMSGTSMAAPQVTGMAAVVGQYIRDNDLEAKTGYTARQLINSLLMSTAEPLIEADSECYYSILKQGAGLANVNSAISSGSFIMMAEDATDSFADGKVKVELGDDPERTGEYSFSFLLNNMTDAEKYFDFDADFFTQDWFSYQGAYYRDTWTALLNADVTFTVNGEVTAALAAEDYDFNGDGFVDELDGRFLLALAAGLEPEAGEDAADNYDVSGDGEFTTYDAYCFFLLLEDTATVVPANGSVLVTCSVKLNDVDDYDDKGTYVEGYVYATERTSDEGTIGDMHSIPVIGYYGGWTESSMFDRGSYQEYLAGKETYAPYMYTANGEDAIAGNSLSIQYAGDANLYTFGGNPMVEDETYMPERDAMNVKNGDKIAKLNFVAIRNAGESAYFAYDEDGRELASAAPGAVSAAYYYVNGAVWRQTGYSLNTSFAPTSVEEGKYVTMGLKLIPEYYVKNPEAMNTLGEGAVKSFTFRVDNTAPVVSDISGSIDMFTGSIDSFTVSASDNQYISCVALYDSEDNLLKYYGADLTADEGASSDYAFDVVEGTDRYYVQVFDYAMNCTTYKLNLNFAELKNDISISISPAALRLMRGNESKLKIAAEPWGASEDVTWSSSDETIATVNEFGVVTGVEEGTAVITAASAVNPEATATCTVEVFTVPVTIYGALQDEQGSPQFFSWKMDTENKWTGEAPLATDIAAFTWDFESDYGYQMNTEGYLYKVDMETGETLDTSAASIGFGAPMADIAGSFVYDDILYGVYGGYILYSDGLANTFSSGWNLASYLKTYIGANKFTAVANGGVTTNNGVYVDWITGMTDSGYIWTMSADLNTGKAGLGWLKTDFVGKSWPTFEDSQYCSMVWDDSLETFFLSYFTGDTNEIYMFEYDEENKLFVSTLLGDVGDTVWPAALTRAVYDSDEGDYEGEPDPNRIFDRVNWVATDVPASTFVREIEAAPTGSLNAAPAYASRTPVEKLSSSAAKQEEENYTVTVESVDGEGTPVVANNGLVTVEFDAEALDVSDWTSFADYIAVNESEGKVVIAYVDMDGISEIAAADVAVSGAPAVVTVKFSELGEEAVEIEEVICLHNHANARVEGKIEPTCTEDGYTGDTYCADCGILLEQGKVDPALGHDFDDDGVCTRCGCGEILQEVTWKHSVSANDSLDLNYYAYFEGIEDYDNVWIEAEYETFEGDVCTMKTRTLELESTSSTGFKFVFSGMAAAEIGWKINTVLCAEKDGQVFRAPDHIYSVADYCYYALGVSANAKLQTMMVELLNYGAAAQAHFNVNPSNPCNAALTPEQKALSIGNVDVVGVNETFALEGATVKIANKSVIIGNSPDMKLYIEKIDDNVDMSKAVLEFTYKTVKNASVTGTAEIVPDGNRWSAKVTKIAAANLGQPVSLVVKIDGAAVSDTLRFNTEFYCAAMIKSANSTPELKALCQAMMNFSAAAKAYFLG